MSQENALSRRNVLAVLFDPPPPAWADRVDVLERRGLSPARLVREIVKRSRGYDTVVLDGSEHYDQVAAALILRRRPKPRVVLTDATWSRGGSWLGRLARRLGIRVIDGPGVTYCVLSSEEMEAFPSTWGVDPGRVAFTPFCFTLKDADLAQPRSEEGGVFAGGDSRRDYETLLEAARRSPAPFTIATGLLDGRDDIPPNVHAERVPHERFVELLRHAAVVVVPFPAVAERSAGQQTYLNAMALGKPVIVTDSTGVRDYVEDRRTGLIVPPGDPAAMAAAIDWVLDPADADEVAKMKMAARESALGHFTRENYLSSIFGVVESPNGG
jgi:glycosyltransferase involved in cell wall biosynthesis